MAGQQNQRAKGTRWLARAPLSEVGCRKGH